MRLFFILFLLAFLLTNCKEITVNKHLVEKTLVINSLEVEKKELTLNQIEGKWYFKEQPFNGYSIVFHSNGAIGERLGYYNGKREGIAKKWSDNGVVRVQSYYKQNRLEGVYKSWWENGVLAAESHYVNGVLNGVSKEWYATGELAKERVLLDGKEDGLQRAWLQNGKLYVNYEAKNGRIFGMRRANSCYKLENEVVIKD
ncbi:hypothetical protein OO009_06685 [Flavobacteriaceae bacterium KMM 6897]|nr:hypothetical protein [Flavobacteriaceae bacterium KMM 6897]